MKHYKQTFSALALCVAFLIVATPSAREMPVGAPPAAVPTSQPDRIILSWSGDTATTQSVTWRTSTDVREAFGEIVEAGDAPTFAINKKTFTARRELVEARDINYHSFSLTFTDLKSDTMYHYRVGQGTNWSEWFTFTTGSQGEKPFSFLYFGDAQNGLDTVYPRLVRKAFLTAPQARFAIFAGDLVDVGSHERSWDMWFDALGFLAAMYPIMPVPGNHEREKVTLPDGSQIRPMAPNVWRPLFTLPENGPDSMKESTYTFVYNGVRFIGLDSTVGAYEYRGEGVVAEWLENVLRNNESRWTIVYFHHPIYSAAKGRNHPHWRAAIKPLLDKYGVDLVLQGHDHIYSRTGLQTPHVDVVDLVNVSELDPHSQTVYVTSVSGEKMYELDDKPFFVKTLTNTQLFQVIEIDGNTLTLTAKTATGRVIDSFVIEKTASGKELRTLP